MEIPLEVFKLINYLILGNESQVFRGWTKDAVRNFVYSHKINVIDWIKVVFIIISDLTYR